MWRWYCQHTFRTLHSPPQQQKIRDNVTFLVVCMLKTFMCLTIWCTRLIPEPLSQRFANHKMQKHGDGKIKVHWNKCLLSHLNNLFTRNEKICIANWISSDFVGKFESLHGFLPVSFLFNFLSHSGVLQFKITSAITLAITRASKNKMWQDLAK